VLTAHDFDNAFYRVQGASYPSANGKSIRIIIHIYTSIRQRGLMLPEYPSVSPTYNMQWPPTIIARTIKAEHHDGKELLA
jgi:hypothetical protein|tara:strand:- start:319 stop:558 length:240 start_codon:yes stop_codon:yes gene_type:complete